MRRKNRDHFMHQEAIGKRMGSLWVLPPPGLYCSVCAILNHRYSPPFLLRNLPPRSVRAQGSSRRLGIAPPIFLPADRLCLQNNSRRPLARASALLVSITSEKGRIPQLRAYRLPSHQALRGNPPLPNGGSFPCYEKLKIKRL